MKEAKKLCIDIPPGLSL